jgi:hypothetical protein
VGVELLNVRFRATLMGGYVKAHSADAVTSGRLQRLCILHFPNLLGLALQAPSQADRELESGVMATLAPCAISYGAWRLANARLMLI